MLTNSRLIELRAAGLACQERVSTGLGSDGCLRPPTQLERDYADLFQLVLDVAPEADGYPDGYPGGYRTKTSLAFLLGK